ncbi:MAG: molybdate ABC transporter substrate-binding protein [Pseudomonadota bacterium]|nr:molybdate ABC transporter substrate-binding protein [Pseudomonadota bacterium]
MIFKKMKWLVILGAGFGFYFSQNYPTYGKNILIFAASSLTLPIQKIVTRYQEKSNNRVRVSYAASSILAQQISRGAPTDIFISANQKWMNYLAKKNSLIAQSKRKILSNNLVIISPKNHPVKLKTLNMISLNNILKDGRLGIGDPDHVPLGIHSKEVLDHLNLWQPIKKRLARLKNARAVLTFVERGETKAGIVYQSDAHLNNKVNILFKIPTKMHRKIYYWAALTRSNNQAASRYLFDILFNQNSKDVFKHHGFLVN